jgi:hypothetical protein
MTDLIDPNESQGEILYPARTSLGHLADDERFEYFTFEGEVYRAPLDFAIRCDVPIRNG